MESSAQRRPPSAPPARSPGKARPGSAPDATLLARPCGLCISRGGEVPQALAWSPGRGRTRESPAVFADSRSSVLLGPPGRSWLPVHRPPEGQHAPPHCHSRLKMALGISGCGLGHNCDFAEHAMTLTRVEVVGGGPLTGPAAGDSWVTAGGRGDQPWSLLLRPCYPAGSRLGCQEGHGPDVTVPTLPHARGHSTHCPTQRALPCAHPTPLCMPCPWPPQQCPSRPHSPTLCPSPSSSNPRTPPCRPLPSAERLPTPT